jgi:hypothetical protein
MAEAILQSAGLGLAWGLEKSPVDIEQPAVVAAPDPALGEQPKLQRGAAVGTVQFEQPHGAPAVAERDEILAQKRDTPREVTQIIGKAHRLPEAPEVFPTWCARANVGQLGVFLRNVTMVVTAKTGG